MCHVFLPREGKGLTKKAQHHTKKPEAEPKMTLYSPNSKPGIAARAPLLILDSQSPHQGGVGRRAVAVSLNGGSRCSVCLRGYWWRARVPG